MGSSPPASSTPASHHYGTSRHSSSAGQFLFQPPKSPAVVATTPSIATTTDYFSAGSRKRQRPSSIGDDTRNLPPTWTETSAWAQCPTPSDALYGSGHANADSINEKYDLAGGFDTPSLRSSSRLEHLIVNEHEFRRRLRDDDMDFAVHSGCTPLSGPLARERNGTARMRSSPVEHPQATWTSFAFGLVGKVFSFGTNVVRGFYAGGGQGYDLQNSALVGSDLLEHSKERSATPIPGAWQDADFLGDFEQDSPSFVQAPASRPAAKRRQTDRDAWVVVNTPDLDGAPSSPRRKISSNSVPRSSLAPTKAAASRASSRRSLAPTPRRQTSHYTNLGSPVQPLQPPLSMHSRRASTAQTRSPQLRPSSGGSGAAYMSPEAERFAKRQAKQDLKADKTMTNMGNRIQEMMRQAQEALGTRYSVESGAGGEDHLDDEGFVDDDW